MVSKPRGSEIVGVVGAGTMGSGIAQIAAAAGHRVFLTDAAPGAAQQAVERIVERLHSMVAKGRLAMDVSSVQLSAVDIGELAPSTIVVEAIVERLDVKAGLFSRLEDIVKPDCILATNTSSLPLGALAVGLANPERFVGLHFFNPVPLMKLVEVAPGPFTSPDVMERAVSIAQVWGKQTVLSAATPAFIVNRIARPFYAEAWRLLEDGAATPEVIDAVLVGAGAFSMGPFRLMDLIGHDVNEAVTRMVWDAFAHDPRFSPSLAQRALVESGRLGRKSGHGIYDYAEKVPAPTPRSVEGSPRPDWVIDHGLNDLGAVLARTGVRVESGGDAHGLVELGRSGVLLARCRGVTAEAIAAEVGAPVVVVDRCFDDETASAIAISASADCSPAGIAETAGLFQAGSFTVYLIEDVPGLIVTRTVAMLANLALDAVTQRVASAEDVDTAMKLGTSYPIGPLEWLDRWGARTVVDVLDELSAYYGDGHHRSCPALRRRALTEQRHS